MPEFLKAPDAIAKLRAFVDELEAEVTVDAYLTWDIEVRWQPVDSTEASGHTGDVTAVSSEETRGVESTGPLHELWK